MSVTKHISIRIPSAVLAEVDAQAVADGRSRSQVIVRCLVASRWSGEVPNPVAAGPRADVADVPTHQRAVEAKPDMDALRGICAGSVPEPVEMCPHTEYDEQSGDTYACALPAGHKGKCKRGCRL